jgi:hypothetical protein
MAIRVPLYLHQTHTRLAVFVFRQCDHGFSSPT